MSWNELAAKKLNHVGNQPYFTKEQMQAAMVVAARSEELAKGHFPEDKAAKPAAPSDTSDSSDSASGDNRSTSQQ